MSDNTNLIAYAGAYASADDAKSDFAAIQDAHRKSWIGTYDAALFAKDSDGKVKVLDTDATQRTTGAKAGALVGAVLGMIFPPTILAGAAAGAASGAVLGNAAKGFSKADVKELGEQLLRGETGIMLVADATFDAGAEKLMKKARKFAKKELAAAAAAL
jgi:uncharacterized membrane protein